MQDYRGFFTWLEKSLKERGFECETLSTGGNILVTFARIDERWTVGIDPESIVLYDGLRDGSGDNETMLADVQPHWTVEDIATFIAMAKQTLDKIAG